MQGDADNSVILPPDMTGVIGPVPTVRITQTFYIDTQQPNVLFAAAVPSQVYFPAGGLQVDRYGSIRSPILLDEGMVYSVVSDVPVTEPTILRWAHPPEPIAIDPTYLQLPTDLPARVGALAHRITAGITTQYDQVEAVQSWIRANTKYDLDVPRDPAGVDAVDHFLFVTRTGFCEQIATSLAVMLRTLGIQTRLVTGYGPGERNPLTGYFEVRQSDAHAWVEVFYPGIGWVPYDPTFGVPEAAPHGSSRFIGGEVLAAMGRFLSSVIPDSVKQLVRDAGRGIGVVWDGLVRAWPVALGGARAARAGHRRPASSSIAGPGATGRARGLPRPDGGAGAARSSADRTRHASRVPARASRRTPPSNGRSWPRRRWSWRRSSATGSPGRPAPDADLDRAREAVATVRELVSRR